MCEKRGEERLVQNSQLNVILERGGGRRGEGQEELEEEEEGEEMW